MGVLKDKLERYRRWFETSTPYLNRVHPFVDLFSFVDEELERLKTDVKRATGEKPSEECEQLKEEITKVMEIVASLQQAIVDQEKELNSALEEIKKNREKMVSLENKYQQALNDLLELMKG